MRLRLSRSVGIKRGSSVISFGRLGQSAPAGGVASGNGLTGFVGVGVCQFIELIGVSAGGGYEGVHRILLRGTALTTRQRSQGRYHRARELFGCLTGDAEYTLGNARLL
jgi:hypothetical protein